MDHAPDEAELARRAREGDREALAELIGRVRLRLFALAYAELRHYEDAQDAVAAALLQICRHVGELRAPAQARQWMYRITRNEARLILRRRRTAPLRLGEEESSPGDGGEGPAAEAERALLRLDVERALRQLPRDEARATALFYLAHLSVREIAARLSRPEGTIKRWLHLGRRRLAAELEEYAPLKRREALKLLTVTPLLSTTMEECAAMTPTPAAKAVIISTDLDPATLQSLVHAMKDAGWDEVTTLGVGPVVDLVPGEGELRLVETLRGKHFILLDDRVGGRSAFELHILMKAAAEAKEVAFGMLSASGADSTVRAAWLAGFDLFLTHPVDPAKLGSLSYRCAGERVKTEEAAPAAG